LEDERRRESRKGERKRGREEDIKRERERMRKKGVEKGYTSCKDLSCVPRRVTEAVPLREREVGIMGTP